MNRQYEIRTASNLDVELLTVLFGSSTARYFGEQREQPLKQLFHEYQTHRLIVCEPSDPETLLAYCEFCIYPNIPVLANDCWPQWLKCRFCVDVPLTLMNTIFFNLYVQLPEYPDILKQVLLEIFYLEHKISFLVIARPPNYMPEEFEILESYGKVYYPIAFDLFSCKNLPTIIIISRNDFMPVISFRKALPEDNDDVIDMIDVEKPEMRKEHGDYFIAEMLLGTAGGNMDGDHIIVTEESTSDGSTGMMWLSESADIEALVKSFDLESLGNLVRCTPDVPHGTVYYQVFSAQQRPHFALNMDMFQSQRGTIQLIARKVKEAQVNLEKERIYTKFKYITQELKNSGNYLNKISKTLKISFDLPSGKGSKNKKANLQHACGAFLLKNFILHPDLRLEYTFYYLCAMFSAFPNRDYCVVSIPHGAKYSVSLRALLRFFTPVEHRPSCQVSDEVFVAHRCSVSTELNVYRMEKDDLPDIYKLISFSDKPRSTLDHAGHTVEVEGKCSYLKKLVKQISADVLCNQQTDFNFWIIRCGLTGRENTTTVGFAILRSFSNYEAIFKQFVLPPDESYLTYDRGELVMLRLHPYFHMWTDELLRTMAIRSGFREIFYFQEIRGKVLPNDLAINMMPVEPRRMRRNWFIDTHSEQCYRRASSQVPLPRINCVMDQFYLFRHNLVPSKCIGNQNPLVIIGFSDICKAFLRLMIFGWNTSDFKHVSVNNCLPTVDITVIVHTGEIETEYDPNIKCNYCHRKEDCYLHNANTSPFVMDTTQRLDMRNWINFVAAKVEHIDRDNKFVSLDNNCKIFYDKLLLLNETKFGLPTLLPRKEDITEDKWEFPYNYSHINGRLDKILLYNKVIELNRSQLTDKYIIIYGYTLALYECIDFLLKHGCSSSHIFYVQPHKVRDAEFLNIPTNDRNLDDILVQMVQDLGIHVFESSNYSHYTLHESANFIKTITFIRFPSRKQLTVQCNLFINFMENSLTPHSQQMLIDSDITMRYSKILVGENFCTNDPEIYAAGKHVIFKYDVYYQYVHVSEREIAQKLIDELQLSLESSKKECKFSKPCLFHALLPLNHMVIKITAPKRFLLGCLSNDYCHVMTTYTGEFVRVRMSQKHIIEEIACVTRKVDKPLYFLEYFCGKHETLLNNLWSRWKQNLITDFISFFEKPWTEYLMHDRFDDMQMKNHSTLISLLQQRHVGVEGMNIGDSDFEEACKHFLEANLLQFLRKYRNEFVNQFALPEDWEMEQEY